MPDPQTHVPADAIRERVILIGDVSCSRLEIIILGAPTSEDLANRRMHIRWAMDIARRDHAFDWRPGVDLGRPDTVVAGFFLFGPEVANPETIYPIIKRSVCFTGWTWTHTEDPRFIAVGEAP